MMKFKVRKTGKELKSFVNNLELEDDKKYKVVVECDTIREFISSYIKMNLRNNDCIKKAV